MSPLYINEEEVRALLDMRGTIDALETIFREQAAGEARNMPRQRADYWGGKLNIMSAGARSGRFAFKAYAATAKPTVYHVMLYDRNEGLLAIIEAQAIGQLRTGAASGVATRRLAAANASRIGVIGAGRQARTQLLAIAAVRDLREIRVFARDAARVAAFCDAMSREMERDVRPAASAKACVADAQIVVAATTSSTPVVLDAWLPPDVHVNGVGANAAARMELEPASYARARLVVTDDVDQAKVEAGEIIEAVKAGRKSWSDVRALADIVGAPAPAGGGLTIFKSLGAALEDLASASAIYDRALARGMGRRVRD